jgi:hypothetical protein
MRPCAASSGGVPELDPAAFRRILNFDMNRGGDDAGGLFLRYSSVRPEASSSYS